MRSNRSMRESKSVNARCDDESAWLDARRVPYIASAGYLERKLT